MFIIFCLHAKTCNAFKFKYFLSAGESTGSLTADLGNYNEVEIIYSNGILSIEVSNRNKLFILKKKFSSDEEVLKLTANKLTSVEDLYDVLKYAINEPSNKDQSIHFNDSKEELVLKVVFIRKEFIWKISLEH